MIRPLLIDSTCSVEGLEARDRAAALGQLVGLRAQALGQVGGEQRPGDERDEVDDESVAHASRLLVGRLGQQAEREPERPEEHQGHVQDPAGPRRHEPAPAVEQQRGHGDREQVQERHRAVETARDSDERGHEQRVPDELQVEEERRAGQVPVERRVEQHHPVGDGGEQEERPERLPRPQQDLDPERGDEQRGDRDHPQDHELPELGLDLHALHRRSAGDPVGSPERSDLAGIRRSC